MRRNYTVSLVMGLLALSVLLVACDGSRVVAVGLVETNIGNEATARYQTFTGTKTRQIDAQAGQTIRLAYEVTVSKGSLAIELRDPRRDALWQLLLERDAADVVELPARSAGTYRLVIEGDGTGGSYAISWEVE